MNNTNAVIPVRHGDQIELEIASLAFGGDSVGRYQDFAIFVAGGLPGERVKARITQVKDHYATAEILSVLRRSPDRVEPPCDIFEECGGCQWQHFNYPRQLQTKRQFVLDALKRIGRLDNVTVQPCLPSPTPFAYRNKAMPVLSMRDGHFVSGIYEPRSHHLVPYHTCPIQGDAINDFIQKVLKKIDRSGLTPYQEKKHTGFLRHLAVRQGVKTGEILLAFVTRTETPEERVQRASLMPEELETILPRIARELMQETPGLVGVLQNINASRTNIVFGPSTRTLAGRDHYFEIIDDLKLKVSLKSFLQVNTLQADMLHTIVREALGDPVHKKKWGTILDLYSGIGTLALAVSEKADYVVGVEEVGPAVEDAKTNAELNHRSNIDFLEGDVAPILLGLKEKGLAQIDAAILDPPRKGILPEVLARVTAFHPERLVYVSCDPSTLARDLALLVKHGYAVDWAQPLDMFPQTYHVETVVRLTRETPLTPEVVAPTGQPEMEPFRLPKPVEPASLNISANFNAFKEKTGDLFQAFGQQLGAAFGLGLSIGAGLFAWVKNTARALGRGSDSIPRSNGGASAEKLSRPAPNPLEELGLFVPKETSAGHRALLLIREQSARLTVKIRSAFQTKPKPPSLPATQETPIPVETSIAFRETATVEPKEEIPVLQESSPVPVMEEARSLLAPPAEMETPQAPLQPVFNAAAELSPSLAPPPVEAPHPSTKPEWKLPAIPVPTEETLRWFRGRTPLRWALMAAFLVGGALLAKATLLPQSKTMGLLVPMVSQMIPDVIAVMPTRNYLR
ncbi:MAG TPA: 23S rRNA (uracil(1939)-C(5))-methyltransferase RlmD, partial [bacterium]|nr:23S rRNA (uracil(1939)-C(5))-methyltransferase RlmD [bacterium]